MKKLIAILTTFSLALAVTVQAAKPEEKDKEEAPKPKNAPKQQVAPKPEKQFKAPKQTERVERPAPAPDAAPKVSKKQKPAVSDAPAPFQTDKQTRKEQKPKLEEKKIETEKPQLETKPVQTTNVQPKKAPLDKATVQRIQKQHANFQAKPNTAIASAQFNPNYRIEAAQNWSGPQYEVFRSYQPQWHDQTWYRSRYSNNLSLIGGGWYYWDAGYWYPAWGYDEAYDYYPYDGPIYVGDNARPFDQVVADVQAVLQEQGFYRGEVDGLVGPLTREALAAYQSAEGLPPTAAIDEPTLDSLGLT